MNQPFLTFNRKQALKTLFFVAIIILGVLFIINNARALQIAFYLTGGFIIAASIFMLASFIKSYRQFKQMSAIYQNPLFSGPIIVVIFIGLTMLSGIMIIVNAGGGILFYQSALSFIFLSLSLHRFIQANAAIKLRQKSVATPLIVLGVTSAILTVFFYIFDGSASVVGYVAGAALILEALYGLFQIWSYKLIINKATKNTSFFTSSNDDSPEIIITNYEVIEDDNSKD